MLWMATNSDFCILGVIKTVWKHRMMITRNIFLGLGKGLACQDLPKDLVGRDITAMYAAMKMVGLCLHAKCASC